MPAKLEGPKAPIRITAEPITAAAFAPFGTLVEDPVHSSGGATITNSHFPRGIVANQGSATKYPNITNLQDLYFGKAPSGQAARVSISLFVCKPRKLLLLDNNSTAPQQSTAQQQVSASKSTSKSTSETDTRVTNTNSHIFPVRILERHPFTSQTFIPLGVGQGDERRYLVVVAPSLQAQVSKSNSATDELSAWPYPTSTVHAAQSTQSSTAARESTTSRPRGPPDLTRLKAFMVRGDQAVTYGAGTWHAPMVALGDRELPFTVIQFANGVALEDCQEVEIPREEENTDGGVAVLVPPAPLQSISSRVTTSVPAKL